MPHLLIAVMWRWCLPSILLMYHFSGADLDAGLLYLKEWRGNVSTWVDCALMVEGYHGYNELRYQNEYHISHTFWIKYTYIRPLAFTKQGPYYINTRTILSLPRVFTYSGDKCWAWQFMPDSMIITAFKSTYPHTHTHNPEGYVARM